MSYVDFSWFGKGRDAAKTPNISEAADSRVDYEAEHRSALTNDGLKHGLSWELPLDAERMNFPDAILNSVDGPLASVEMRPSEKGMVAHIGTFSEDRDGRLRDYYPSLAEGMKAAEDWTVERLDRYAILSQYVDAALQPWADASESYHAKLAALAESRGAETAQDVERGSGLER